MAKSGSSGGEVKQQAEEYVQEAAKQASPWIERFARIGYAAYGTVYALVGVLAAQAALGHGGKTAGREGALRSILAAPMGGVLLALVALGLIGYAVWRVFQGIMDPENEGSGAKGAAKRAKNVFDGLFHGALALSAAQLALGSSGGGGGPDDWTARLMAQPFGRWLVVAIGAGILIAGTYQFYELYRVRFMQHLKPGEMSDRERTWTRRIGRIGYAARGIVFGVMGIFLMLAALHSNPQEARGLGGALQTLDRQPFGPYILGIVALGFVAYGAFMFVVARYRRIRPA